MKPPQFELPNASDVFNLAGEQSEDPMRVLREQWARDESRVAVQEYEQKMQRLLSECPGFVGGDMPKGPASIGKVVIEPALIMEATQWLKRRFQISERLELSTDTGLCLEIASRASRKLGAKGFVKRIKFGKPEQFEFSL